MLSVLKTYSMQSSDLKDKCVIPANNLSTNPNVTLKNLTSNTKANIDFTHVLFLGSGIVIGGAIVLSKVLIDKKSTDKQTLPTLETHSIEESLKEIKRALQEEKILSKDKKSTDKQTLPTLETHAIEESLRDIKRVLQDQEEKLSKDKKSTDKQTHAIEESLRAIKSALQEEKNTHQEAKNMLEEVKAIFQENNKTLELKLDTLKTQYDQEKLRMQTEIKALKEEIDITKDIDTKFHKFKDFYLSEEHNLREIGYKIDELKMKIRIETEIDNNATNKEIWKKHLEEQESLVESLVFIKHIRKTLSEISINMDKLSSSNQIEFSQIHKKLSILLNKLK